MQKVVEILFSVDNRLQSKVKENMRLYERTIETIRLRLLESCELATEKL